MCESEDTYVFLVSTEPNSWPRRARRAAVTNACPYISVLIQENLNNLQIGLPAGVAVGFCREALSFRASIQGGAIFTVLFVGVDPQLPAGVGRTDEPRYTPIVSNLLEIFWMSGSNERCTRVLGGMETGFGMRVTRDVCSPYTSYESSQDLSEFNLPLEFLLS